VYRLELGLELDGDECDEWLASRSDNGVTQLAAAIVHALESKERTDGTDNNRALQALAAMLALRLLHRERGDGKQIPADEDTTTALRVLCSAPYDDPVLKDICGFLFLSIVDRNLGAAYQKQSRV
jgi:hypothetical protein